MSRLLSFFQKFFSKGAKSIVMKISIVMLIPLLFSNQILGEASGGQTASGGAPSVEGSQPQCGSILAAEL